MLHPERKDARRLDTPGRCRRFTDRVYSGPGVTFPEVLAAERAFDPAPSEYHIYFGELHCHTGYSDGQPELTPGSVLEAVRDVAKLDFCAVTDHDHGGVGGDELWKGKWQKNLEALQQYNEPGVFTTIPAYERDSYPWYNNCVLYFNSYQAEMIRGVRDGELTRAELEAILAREDVLLVPHDSYDLSPGCDFSTMPPALITRLIEVCSRGDAAEYFDNPYLGDACCRGGFWQDALARGAKMGVIAASDDHAGTGGQIVEALGFPAMYPGITGVLAKENTLPALFEALRARRCYGFMGGRMWIDFRVNDHVMGEEITDTAEGTRTVFFDVKADAPVSRITLVKNNEDLAIFRKATRQVLFDYRREQPTDWYYLRVELEDGRMGWTSPVWVSGRPETEGEKK